MRQQFQTKINRVVPPVIALVILVACSQAPSSQNQPATPGFTSVLTDASQIPSPTPSQPTVLPSGNPAPALQQSPEGQQGGTSAPPSATTTPPNTGISQPSAAPSTSDSLSPTMRTMQRMAGFSTDGNYYMYLEGSRDTGAGVPRLAMQVVDLSANTCVKGGCVSTPQDEAHGKQSLSEAEQELLKRTWILRQDLKLTQPTEGTILSILARSRTPNGTETVTVRLNDGSKSLKLRLQQTHSASSISGGSADRDRSAMQIEITYNGQQRSLGSLEDYRDWVLDYSIREVRQSPDGSRIAVLITATKPTFEGNLGTTLVQGFAL